MESRYELFIEAVAEWFMQLFFDPMYHLSNTKNDRNSLTKERLANLKQSVSETLNSIQESLINNNFKKFSSSESHVFPDVLIGVNQWIYDFSCYSSLSDPVVMIE